MFALIKVNAITHSASVPLQQGASQDPRTSQHKLIKL